MEIDLLISLKLVYAIRDERRILLMPACNLTEVVIECWNYTYLLPLKLGKRILWIL